MFGQETEARRQERPEKVSEILREFLQRQVRADRRPKCSPLLESAVRLVAVNDYSSKLLTFPARIHTTDADPSSLFRRCGNRCGCYLPDLPRLLATSQYNVKFGSVPAGLGGAGLEPLLFS